MIAKKLTDLIGNTPLLEFSNFNASKGLKAKVIGKLEYFNPASSVKDRIALANDRRCGRKGFAETGSNNHRADQREHRRRTGFRLGRQRL